MEFTDLAGKGVHVHKLTFVVQNSDSPVRLRASLTYNVSLDGLLGRE